MWVSYDLEYKLTKAGTECIHRDIGIINTENVQSIEISEAALYIYFSDSHHLRIETCPEELFDAFSSIISGSKQVVRINDTLLIARIA